MTQPTNDPQEGRDPGPDGSKADGPTDGAAPNGSTDGSKANGSKASATEGPDDPTGGAAPNGSKANGAAEPRPDIPDPFDPEAYRMPPEGEPGSGVEVQPTRLKIRKPKKTEFFRCHHTLRMMASILEKEVEGAIDKVYYMAAPAVAVMNPGEFKLVELCLCINREGTQFVWPIPQSSGSGKANEWGVTARDGAHKSLAKWVRLKADMANRQYTVIVAKVNSQDPAWQPMTLQDMLKRTFDEGEFIVDEDHPAMKALRGE